MKVPLILKEVESRTEDINEKIIISQILEIEEKSIRKFFLLTKGRGINKKIFFFKSNFL